jgi:hypothetical protein
MTQTQTQEAHRAKWGRIAAAVRISGVNRTRIYELIKEGRIESFVLKSHPGAVSGARMINLDSLTAFLDAEAAKAKQVASK